MRNKILSAVAFIFPLVAVAQSPYDPSEQDREENVGCLSSRCIANMELDNRNLPLIRVAPSYSTRLKFPREVVKCEDETDTIRITDADSPDDDGKAPKHARKPFWQARVKVVIDPSRVQGSIFNMPEVNVLCDFTNGDTVTFYAKVSPDPHHIVRFVDKGVEQSGLAWLFEQQQKGGVIPIELGPKRTPAPVDVVRFDNGTGRSERKSEKEVLERLFAEEGRRKKK
jgi:hypothetical protein